MTTEQTEVQLPMYVRRAITSETARSGNYAFLSPEQWKDIADHLLRDETVEIGNGSTFLPRGSLISQGSGGVRAILDGILYDAVSEHRGVESKMPHYQDAEMVFHANRLEKLREERRVA